MLVFCRIGFATRVGIADCKDDRRDMNQSQLAEDFSSKKAFCQNLEKKGLLHILTSGEPEELGFTFEWYRHTAGAARGD